jgi:hypothetical protein
MSGWRSAWSDDSVADDANRMAVEKVENRGAVLGTDAGQDPKGPSQLQPVPGHVEDATARQDVWRLEIVIEADRPEQEGLVTLHQRPARGSARPVPRARNRS